MAYSMTGYASHGAPVTGGMARWEIRSVNHRYLELSFKLPHLLNELEFPLREILKRKLARGKVECFLKLDLTEGSAVELAIDFALADKLMEANKILAERFLLSDTVSGFEILQWPMVVKTIEKDFSVLKPILQQSFETALDQLIEMRGREGLKLKTCILERIAAIHILVDGIKKRVPEFEKSYKAKFEKKLHELKLEVSSERFDPMMVSLVQKMDVTEELDRLKMHLTEVERILSTTEPMGRRLDFLMQELNREANTLGSKAMDGITVQEGVQLKVLIEEMREQIQNLE